MLKTRLEKFYEKVVCEDWILLYNLKNQYTLPVFEKAVLNSTSNNLASQKDALLQCSSAFFLQTGKAPVNTRAHKSIALFNIRQGSILGLKTTLRKQSLYNYLDKALIFVIPKAFSSRALQTSMESVSTKVVFKKKKQSFVRYKTAKGFAAKETELLKSTIEQEIGADKRFSFTDQSAVQSKDFVISENKVTRFPEMLSLLLFFNSTIGFSLDCSISLYGQKALPKFLPSKKKKVIGCNKKNSFISAFGYPALS